MVRVHPPLRVVGDAGLAYDHSTRTGVTLHLLGALTEHGKLGATCIGDTPEQAQDLYYETLRVVDATAALKKAT